MKKSFFASFFVSKKVREYRQEGWMVVRKMWPWWGECLFASFSAPEKVREILLMSEKDNIRYYC